jgi:hypothetical protein
MSDGIVSGASQTVVMVFWSILAVIIIGGAIWADYSRRTE